MKTILFFCLLCFSTLTIAAEKHAECSSTNALSSQVKTILEVAEKMDKECPAPKINDFSSLCSDVASRAKVPELERKYYDYHFEKRLWTLSCADPARDDMEKAKVKIQAMWEKYKTRFKCDTLSFSVPNGNFLKFTLSQNMPEVIETLVTNYDIDINFIDPTDKRNVLDYLNDEIAKLKKQGADASTLKVYADYREIIIDNGAKPSKP